MSEFYGYKHWTLEEFPRCFYVGKGIASRAYSKRSRNHKTEKHRQAIQAALKGNPRVSLALMGNQHTKGRKIPADEIAKRSASLRLTNARKRLLRLLITRDI